MMHRSLWRPVHDAWRPVRDAWRPVHEAVSRSQYAVLVVLLVAIVMYSIPLSRTWLLRMRVIDDQTILGLIGFAILAVVYSLKGIHSEIRQLCNYVHSRLENHSPLMGGAIQVNEMISDLIPHIRKAEQRWIEVLGMTLDTAWPMIRHWIGREEIRDCEIRLHCIDPFFAMENKSLIGTHAADTARDVSEHIDEYVKHNADVLAEKSITINLKFFRTLPPIHDVMLGNGTLFVALAQWIGGDPADQGTSTIYEYFSGDDDTPRAITYRNMFRRWLAEGRVMEQPRERQRAV